MRHRDGKSLERRLIAARTAILARAEQVEALFSRLVLAARAHERRPREAGLALERIASARLFRLRGYRTLEAFLRAELGISRATAHRLRVAARKPEARPTRGAERDALVQELRRRLRDAGVRQGEVRVEVRGRGGVWIRIAVPASVARRLRIAPAGGR